MTTLNIPELDAPFIFSSRPESLPGDLRPLWRIGTILLILRMASRGGKSSLVRLHVLNWSVRTLENQQTMREFIAGRSRPDVVLVRIEPSLNRALDLARGEGLLDRAANGRIELNERGKMAADAIVHESSIFAQEKEFLQEIGKNLTENLVEGLFRGRR